MYILLPTFANINDNLTYKAIMIKGLAVSLKQRHTHWNLIHVLLHSLSYNNISNVSLYLSTVTMSYGSFFYDQKQDFDFSYFYVSHRFQHAQHLTYM